ncbi:hypothetical protein [Jeotgalibacillus sp. JSM ZJ347]|uniref:hypothetical protein n=1 Tax=Jeotgalibacillus sp. JSM ZJ347 TaxID=3342117 RepID=UPI0035A94481
MGIVLFFIVHLIIGLGLIYFRSKLPSVLVTFGVVFLVMSVLYWGRVIIDMS